MKMFSVTPIITLIADGSIILSSAGVEGQWRRIAGINISAGDDCPTKCLNGVSLH